MFCIPCVNNSSATFFFSFCQALPSVFACGMMLEVHTITVFFPLPSQQYARIFTGIYLALHWESDFSVLALTFLTVFGTYYFLNKDKVSGI